jgi:hypothetical protein
MLGHYVVDGASVAMDLKSPAGTAPSTNSNLGSSREEQR